MGCSDRGMLGGFSSGLLRRLRKDSTLKGKARSWAMAAATSYQLKNIFDREEVCLRLATLHAPEQAEKGGLGAGSSIENLPGVGAALAQKLQTFGLKTIGDLLEHLPRDYIDRRTMRTIRELRTGEEVTVVAKVKSSKVDRTRTGKRIVRVTITDGTGYVDCIWWNQEWRARQLQEGIEAAFSGKVERRQGRLQMNSPIYDLISSDKDPVHTGRVVGVYPASESVSAVWLRRLLHSAFENLGEIGDILPARIRAEANLLGAREAIKTIHFPNDPSEIPEARRRLVFEELFVLEVALALRKHHLEQEVRGIAHEKQSPLPDELIASLPFRLTSAQVKANDEIEKDMVANRPMHRLLQGEVGSGKTLVAVCAALRAVDSGTQAAVMAPTEVLAEQHARSIRRLLDPLGVDVALLTSSVPAQVRRDAQMRLESGDISIAVGTHALISEGVSFKRLSLAVIDEQHRFGLAHRTTLRAKGEDPDVLIMTATPIPRTLALTLYGDLDVSVLDELPAGRRPITTRIADSAQARHEAYELVRREANAGRRAFVVCPLVDESDKLEATAAVAEAARLSEEVFPDLEVGLLHGQMRPAEKDRVMDAFRRGGISVLIATTVVEVGVDVPEATVMLIENAERFGLSQLHQLRGRVGRGENASYCILFSQKGTEDGRRRLEAIAATDDGFALAETDLEIRGEGTIFGNRQAGMVDLKVARLVEDFPVVVEARKAAFALVDSDPKLKSPELQLLRAEVQSKFEASVHWLFKG